MNYRVSYISEKCLIPLIIGIVLISFSCRKEPGIKIALDDSADTLNPGKASTSLRPGIALTFDDNYLDEWIAMLPILKKYNARVTFFISLNYPVKNINSAEKILKLFNAGNEIGLHTLNHPHLSTYLKHHSINYYYKEEILPEMQYMNSLGIIPSSFAYPFGEYTKESNSFLSKYFNKIRCLYTFSNIKKVEKFIGASIILSSNLKDYKDQILYAKLDSNIWVLDEHRIAQKVNGDDTFSYNMLDSICKFVREQNLRFYCMEEIDTLIFEKQSVNRIR